MRIPNTFERLRRRYRAAQGRENVIATVGAYAITDSEDLYFRALYAAISLGYMEPKFG